MRCSISWESLGNFQGGKGTPWIYARNYSKSLICSFRWLSLADLLLKNLLSHSMVPCFMNAPCLKCLASGSQECGGLVDRHNEGCHFDLIWFHTQSSRTAGSNWNRCCQHDLWVRPSSEVKQVCYSCYSEIHDWIHECSGSHLKQEGDCPLYCLNLWNFGALILQHSEWKDKTNMSKTWAKHILDMFS